MSQEPRFGRMIPAMVTPFDENRELDVDKVQALAARLVVDEASKDINVLVAEMELRVSVLGLRLYRQLLRRFLLVHRGAAHIKILQGALGVSHRAQGVQGCTPGSLQLPWLPLALLHLPELLLW